MLQCIHFHYSVFVLKGIITLLFALAEILLTVGSCFDVLILLC